MAHYPDPIARHPDQGAPLLMSPTDLRGILLNLGWHALFVLDPASERIIGMVPAAGPVPVASGEFDSDPRERAHVAALLKALRWICPAVVRRMSRPFATPSRGYDFSRLFRAELAGLLSRTDPRAAVICSQVRTALEESLIHWPLAYSRFCREIVTVEPDLPRLLALLARAAGHASTEAEFRQVEQAQAEVTKRMRGKFTVPMPAGAAPIFTATQIAQVVDTPAGAGGKASSRGVARRIHFSRRQEQVLDHCSALGELFFSYRAEEPGLIEPRLFPLICAPTGAGKSMLVGTLARRLGAHYLRVQRGDMAPQGASRMRATVFTILDALALHERTLLCVDELDKFTTENSAPTPTGEWGAGIFSDLWSILDGVLPITTYLETSDRVRPIGIAVDVGLLQRRARCGLWIVGCGTWQATFTGANRAQIGFCRSAVTERREIGSSEISAAQQISPELLARFNADIQVLSYPAQDELPGLLEATGITELARSCNYVIQPRDLEFERGGFRVLETLVSRLLVMQHRAKSSGERGAAGELCGSSSLISSCSPTPLP